MAVDLGALDGDALDELMGKVVTDLGAIALAPLLSIGERLGLFRALADGEAVTPAELGERTATVERNVREWLAAMAASGYVTYVGEGRYRLSPEQVAVFTDEDSPVFVLGGFQAFAAAARPETRDRLERAFLDGHGVAWHEHHRDLFAGTARFFRPGYALHLVAEWLPALDGVVDRLRVGANVADVGCGLGHSTLLMAKAFPGSRFSGFDYHAPSIDAARELAAESGAGESGAGESGAGESGEGARVTFEVAGGKDFGGGPYDLVAYFDCLHDMGDPVGVLAHTREQLAPDGTVMLVEPFSHDDVSQNLNPLGRAFYSASSLICVPASQSQEVGRALGAQAGEQRIHEVATEAGFGRFRRAAETPFNIIYEVGNRAG
ncbi:methyltransferase domain-containing protein [Kitasatospora sp. GP82]|uniref:class I SAM-dependent methyltransferase n=1 Tax=Kitasatospora sp. GP82 TaxID=3035089 RepID=UPI002474DDA6|nr:methyltransferase domain-containing protein [Kitasatospora sp. GP82]MDH6128561.1 SAM-dependent methyltransferase [Kitasatospora sp. GP82]